MCAQLAARLQALNHSSATARGGREGSLLLGSAVGAGGDSRSARLGPCHPFQAHRCRRAQGSSSACVCVCQSLCHLRRPHRVPEAGGPLCALFPGAWELRASARAGAQLCVLRQWVTRFADGTVCDNNAFSFRYNVKGLLLFVSLNLRQSFLFPGDRWFLADGSASKCSWGPAGANPGSRNSSLCEPCS